MINADNLEKYAIAGTILTGLAVGTFMLVRSQVQKSKVATLEETTLEPGAISSIATQFKMAFENDNYFGWGTDLPAVYAACNQIKKYSDYLKVQSAYSILFKSSLAEDLRSELSTSEYAKVMAILAKKPKK